MSIVAAAIATLPRTGRRLSVSLVTETFTPEVNGLAMTVERLVKGLLARGHRVQLIRPCSKRTPVLV